MGTATLAWRVLLMEPFAAQAEVGGDGAVRHADERARGPGEVERGGDLAEEGLREGCAGEKIAAGDLKAAAGDGRGAG
jgi:hypothetical protein